MRGCTRIGYGSENRAERICTMNITQIGENQQVEQISESENWHTGDSPLDLYAIFSRDLRNRHEQVIAQDRDYRYLMSDANLRHVRTDRIANTRKHLESHNLNQKYARINRPRHELKIHRNMIKVSVHSAMQQLPSGLAKRGNVTSFSRKSRKRMVDLMNSHKHGAPQAFVSLTYADEALFTSKGQRCTSPDDWKRHLEMLRKRIERLLPNVRAIWRIELQNRKSGDFKGWIAPHFHLLIWDVHPDDIVVPGEPGNEVKFSTWLQNAWYEIVGTGLDKHLKHGTHISEVKSSKHAMFYVSKYVAKEDAEYAELYEVGRRWGRIGQFDVTASIIHMMDEQTCNHFKRLLRAYLKSKNRDYHKRIAKSKSYLGFTVYGLGDEMWDLHKSDSIPLVLKMLRHAEQLRDCQTGID